MSSARSRRLNSLLSSQTRSQRSRMETAAMRSFCRSTDFRKLSTRASRGKAGFSRWGEVWTMRLKPRVSSRFSSLTRWTLLPLTSRQTAHRILFCSKKATIFPGTMTAHFYAFSRPGGQGRDASCNGNINIASGLGEIKRKVVRRGNGIGIVAGCWLLVADCSTNGVA